MTERWGGEPTEPIPGSQGARGGYPGYGQPAGGDPTQIQPRGGPPGRGGYDDRDRKRRRNWLIAAGVLAVVIIVVLVVLLLTRSSGNSNAVDITAFTVPSTVRCTGPTSIGVSWTTSNATQVALSIDGSIYRTYTGPSGADTVPFACNGATHTYKITATGPSLSASVQSQTVSQSSTPTTAPTTTAPTTTTTKPPPTTSSTTSTSTTTTT